MFHNKWYCLYLDYADFDPTKAKAWQTAADPEAIYTLMFPYWQQDLAAEWEQRVRSGGILSVDIPAEKTWEILFRRLTDIVRVLHTQPEFENGYGIFVTLVELYRYFYNQDDHHRDMVELNLFILGKRPTIPLERLLGSYLCSIMVDAEDAPMTVEAEIIIRNAIVYSVLTNERPKSSIDFKTIRIASSGADLDVHLEQYGENIADTIECDTSCVDEHIKKYLPYLHILQMESKVKTNPGKIFSRYSKLALCLVAEYQLDIELNRFHNDVLGITIINKVVKKGLLDEKN